MNFQLFSQSFIIGICFVFWIFYFVRAVFVYKKIDNYFYFSITAFGLMIVMIAELMQTISNKPEVIVIFHRMKLFGLLPMMPGWFLSIYEIAIKEKKKIPVIYSIVYPFAFIPLITGHAITLPVRKIVIDTNILGTFTYQMGTTTILYLLIGAMPVLFAFYTLIIGFIYNKELKYRILTTVMLLPILLGGINDFSVGKGLIKNILLSQYFAFLYITAIFIVFLIEDERNYNILKNINKILEEEVRLRTEDLNIANEKLKASNDLLKKELKMAQKIQMAIIPQIFPLYKDINVSAMYLPMEELGGDFYDIIHIDNNHIGVVMADVSGHGVPAALITMMAKMSFNNNSLNETDAGKIISTVNNDICKVLVDLDNYITAFFGVINIKTLEMNYVNAGHNEIIVINNDRLEFLKANEMFLGKFSDIQYNSIKVKLNYNDKIVLYTDGIPEARNANGDFYSYERFNYLILKNRDKKANELIKIIKEDVNSFRGDGYQNDDMALLIVEFIKDKEKVKITTDKEEIIL